MILRNANAAELDRICEILAEGRRAIATLGIDQWQNGYPSRDIVLADIERGESYVLERDGELIGTCMITVSPDETYAKIYNGSWLINDGEKYLTVHRIALSDSSRGSGGASYVFERAFEMAGEQRCLSVRADTHPGNVRMRRFLKKMGLSERGTIFLNDRDEPTPQRIAFEKLV